MIKHISFILLFSVFSCQFGESPIAFSEAALADKLITIDEKEITLASVLDKSKGKAMVVNFWASWCGDCIVGMPKLKKLQANYPEVGFVFLSLDRSKSSWKRGIKKYRLQGEHYFMKSGFKGAIADFVDLDWIPRYMIVDKKGEIKIFKAINSGDINIKKRLDQIK